MVMASGHGRRRSGRLAHAMIRGDCRLRRIRPRHREGGRHRGKRAREQDQQQEFGGPANHILRIRKEGSPAAARSSPTPNNRLRDRNGAAAVVRIWQFVAEHNPVTKGPSVKLERPVAYRFVKTSNPGLGKWGGSIEDFGPEDVATVDINSELAVPRPVQFA